jgi:N6-L-threonylcarbamoyladenine synthase
VARILGLGYPGGPRLSKIAQLRSSYAGQAQPDFEFTLPLQNSKNLNFSFSGLKTAVLYKALEITRGKKLKEILEQPPKPDLNIPLSRKQKADLAWAFQEVAVESLLERTKQALAKYSARTAVLGGGVAANQLLRERWVAEIPREFPRTRVLLPPIELTGDNAAMLIPVTYLKWQKANAKKRKEYHNNWITLEPDSNLPLK